MRNITRLADTVKLDAARCRKVPIVVILNEEALLLWVLRCASLSRRQRRGDAISLYDTLTGLLSGRVFRRGRQSVEIRYLAVR